MSLTPFHHPPEQTLLSAQAKPFPSTHSHRLSASLIAALASLGGFAVGYDTGVIAGAELLLRKNFSLSPSLEELVISAVLIGAIGGAAVGGKISDALGRKPTLIIFALLFAIGALLTAFSWTLWLFVAFRILTGLSIGITILIVPIYISEMVPAAKRGALVSYNQFALSASIPIAYWIGIVLVHAHLGWRTMFGIESIPALLFGIGMLFLPETPSWLAQKGRWDEMNNILERVVSPAEKEKEASALRSSLAMKKHTSIRELFGPGLRIALMVGLGLAVFQEIVGTGAISYYAPTIFRYAGFQAVSVDILATSLIGVVSTIGKLLAIFLLDRLGRRPLLLSGLSGMALPLIALGFIFLLRADHGGYLTFICLMIYILSYAIGIGPIFSLMVSEIFPARLRGVGASISSIVNWGTTLLVSITFLTLVTHLGKSWTFWLYALLALAAIVFCWWLVPETKGKSLTDIESYWENGRHW